MTVSNYFKRGILKEKVQNKFKKFGVASLTYELTNYKQN